MPPPDAPSPVPEIPRQVAALPWRRRDGVLEVCLVTTRETKRWTIPKGWPIKGLTAAASAAREAEEEAGVKGVIAKKPIGSFTYWKRRETRFDLLTVDVYPLEVTKIRKTWKEKAERQLRWASPEEAAEAVDEPELVAILRGFSEAS